MTAPAGYSGTALVRKLGIRPGARLGLLGAPARFEVTLGKLPQGVAVRRRASGPLDVIVAFHAHHGELERRLPALRAALDLDGGLWIAWPKREYARNVEAFCDWLAEVDNEGWGGDPLGDPLARDYAALDFKRFLKVERGLRPASVNLALASLDSLYRCLGLGSPNVRREELPQAAPRALDVDEQRRLLRAAERASARDRAIVLSMLFATVRLAELVALDVGDVHTTARKGRLVIRSGKGDAFREVPLNALLRQVLDEWLEERKQLAREDEEALFVSARGTRLSARATDSAVRKLARDAGIEASAHVLRHTCLTGMVRGGHDLVVVAELAGHRRLETTRRYSLPNEADRQAAVDSLEVEY
ncbi:MAG: tyrosine-type recombinase/integrase [Solirubrobacteraceae bacterium]